MKMNQLLTICGIATALFLSAGSGSAQTNNDNASGNGDNSDTAQQRFMGRVHDGLGFTNETDWNAVQPLVQKVFDAQRDVMRSGGMSRMINNNRRVNGTNVIAAVRSRAVLFGQPSPEPRSCSRPLMATRPTHK